MTGRCCHDDNVTMIQLRDTATAQLITRPRHTWTPSRRLHLHNVISHDLSNSDFLHSLPPPARAPLAGCVLSNTQCCLPAAADTINTQPVQCGVVPPYCLAPDNEHSYLTVTSLPSVNFHNCGLILIWISSVPDLTRSGCWLLHSG